MLTNFTSFGLEHIISLIVPILIGALLVFLSKKYSNKQKAISIILAIVIIVIRFVRYGFDIYFGTFNPLDLLSLHVCNIDLYILIICLLWPNKYLFSFVFLVGIPTALSVALMPGKVHPEPGMFRAIFFIMSHMMLIIGAIYLLIIDNFKISKKTFFDIFSDSRDRHSDNVSYQYYF